MLPNPLLLFISIFTGSLELGNIHIDPLVSANVSTNSFAGCLVTRAALSYSTAPPYCLVLPPVHMAGPMRGHTAESAHVWVDKDGTAHYSGDPAYAEEWEERALLGFESCITLEAKRAYPARLKNGLYDRAWTMCRNHPNITAAKINEMVYSTTDAQGPLVAVRQVISVVRALCEKVAPLKKTQLFDEFFFEGVRKPHEPIQDFIQRRSAEYDRLKSISRDTSLSEDLRTYFLLKLSGISKEKHKSILGQAGNEYQWIEVVEAMQIQLDDDQKSTRQQPHMPS